MRTKKKTHYTITEAARKLRISRQAVFEAIKKGDLISKWGTVTVEKRARFIPASSLNAYRVSKRHQKAGKKSPADAC